MKSATISFSNGQLDELVCAINKLKVKSAEKFYTKFYTKIVTRTDCFINSNVPASGVLVLTKLCTILIGAHQKKSDDYSKSVTEARNISERERAGLQYLGGYILRNIFFAMQKSINAENKAKMKSFSTSC